MTRTQGSGELDVASARHDSRLTCPLLRLVTPGRRRLPHDGETPHKHEACMVEEHLVLLGPRL